jgi:hypothetical protein
VRGVDVHLTTRWDLTEPPGGGDAHDATIIGTRSRVRVEQGPPTGFRRRLVVEPRCNAAQVGVALDRALAAWQSEFPGLAAVAAREGYEVRIPAVLGTAHEAQFPLVLDEFLRSFANGDWPDERARATLAKYDLLARALAATPA